MHNRAEWVENRFVPAGPRSNKIMAKQDRSVGRNKTWLG